MPYKRKRTEAVLEAERRYKAKVKRVHLVFHEDKDAELLEFLRSQVDSDSELPGLIKKLLTELQK